MLNLRETLELVESFSAVKTLQELLLEIELKITLKELENHKNILEDSLLLFTSNNTERQCYQKTKELIGPVTSSLEDFIFENLKYFEEDSIQRVEDKSGETSTRKTDLNHCLNFLLSDSMHFLLQKLGNQALFFLINSSLLLLKKESFYWQIWGKRITNLFEEMKKPQKKEL